MNLCSMLAAAALALAAVPAMADGGQRFDWQAQEQAYGNRQPPNFGRCFNGRFIVGANRSSATKLYVQSHSGEIYGVRLGEGCDVLNAAEKVSLRSNGSDMVCSSQAADLVVQTSSGAKHCHAAEVRQLTSSEVMALATGAKP